MTSPTVLPDYAALKNSIQIASEWKRWLASKGTEDRGSWLKVVETLRELAAVLRDATLPIGDERDHLEALVAEMSAHLPERRTAGR